MESGKPTSSAKTEEQMIFKLKMLCDNAAFEDDAGTEIGHILRRLATDVDGMIRQDAKGTYSGGLRDTNGNTVGKWECSP
jgi:hypothetical protein